MTIKPSHASFMTYTRLKFSELLFNSTIFVGSVLNFLTYNFLSSHATVLTAALKLARKFLFFSSLPIRFPYTMSQFSLTSTKSKKTTPQEFSIHTKCGECITTKGPSSQISWKESLMKWSSREKREKTSEKFVIGMENNDFFFQFPCYYSLHSAQPKSLNFFCVLASFEVSQWWAENFWAYRRFFT